MSWPCGACATSSAWSRWNIPRLQSRLELVSAGWRRHGPDLGRKPGDPALESRREPVDPSGRGLRRLRAAPGDTHQREAILRALERYNPTAMAVFNIDLGHTDPQWILPYGGMVTVDGPARRIIAHY